MDREQLRLAVVHAIENRRSEGPADPAAFDVDAIVGDIMDAAREGPVQELDGVDYWAIIARHRRA